MREPIAPGPFAARRIASLVPRAPRVPGAVSATLRTALPAACFAVLLAGPLTSAAAQELPRTAAERSSYARTSSSADVMAYLDEMATAGAPITVGLIGHTAEGRPIPLVVAADPPVTSAREARRSGKLVVYVQANIHGGEVEGKEAVQVLLRELAGPRRALLDDLVLLVAPVYNPDGNDAFGPGEENRSNQDGPARVGLRPNGMRLDLNRDYVKAEAPETRATLAHVYGTWDPAVMLDLHATNGTRHGYVLTYSPPLNPNGPPGPTGFARDSLLPAVREALGRDGIPVFPYGNVDDPLDPDGWRTYSPLAWYGTNYVGMRGRIGILSEAYSHADFRTRVEATHAFVVEVLEYAAAHADAIRRIVAAADRETTLEGRGDTARPELAVDFEFASRGVEPVVLERMRERPAATERPGADGAEAEARQRRRRLEPTGRYDTLQLPVFDRFEASDTERLPGGYFLPPGEAEIVELLRLHGLEVRRLTGDWAGPGEVFEIDSLAPADRPFEGHRLLAVYGAWRADSIAIPTGAYYVSTAQPLGRLAFELLEPRGYGFARWNLFDRLLGRAEGALAGLVYGSRPVAAFPAWRVDRDPKVPMRRVERTAPAP